MDQYLTCLGSSALSLFRRRDLAIKLGLIEIRAQFLHYVALKPSPQGRQADYDETALHELLTYGDDTLEEEPEGENGVDTYFVFPRYGTISPWSSKSTS